MIVGLDTATFTLIHVLLSLVGIGAGFIVIAGLIGNRRARGVTGVFLATTVLTSVTGFMFPYHGMTPGIILGILSLIVLLLAIYALYAKHVAGGWRGTYVVSATAAQYFNVFVLVAQLYGKVPALKAIAPTQQSPVFAITQLIVLAIMIFLGVRAFKRFRGL